MATVVVAGKEKVGNQKEKENRNFYGISALKRAVHIAMSSQQIEE